MDRQLQQWPGLWVVAKSNGTKDGEGDILVVEDFLASDSSA